MEKQLPVFVTVLVLVMALPPTFQGSRRILQVVPPASGPSAPSSSPSPLPVPSAPGSSPSPAPGPSAPSSSPSPASGPTAPSSSPSPAPGSGPSPSPELPPLATPPPPPPPLPSGNIGVRGGGGGGSSGLSGGQKACIVIGVLTGAGLIGFSTLVYMKHRSNIRRAGFSVLAKNHNSQLFYFLFTFIICLVLLYRL